MKENIMIYIDLDGVMADFYGAVESLTGSKEYSKDIWKVIEKEDNFFYNLKRCEGAWRLISYLESLYIKGEFLTALPLPTGKLWQAQKDKVDWVRSTLQVNWQVNCVQDWGHKRYFCRTNRDILIDDLERNCRDWEDAGGIAILHNNFDDTLKKLKDVI